MTFAQFLKAHNSAVEKLQVRPHLRPCGCPNQFPLKVHELLQRRVRYIEGGMVYRSAVLLIRWLCFNCKRSFRHFPDFLEPFKRYVTPCITERTGKVLKSKRLPYQNSALTPPPRRQSIIYEEGDGRSLSRVTIWRWIQWMALVMRKLLEDVPEVAKCEPPDDHEFSSGQAREENTMENLYLARRLWLGPWLTPK